MFIPAEVIDSDAESGLNNFITKSQDFGNSKFMVQGFCLLFNSVPNVVTLFVGIGFCPHPSLQLEFDPENKMFCLKIISSVLNVMHSLMQKSKKSCKTNQKTLKTNSSN